MKTTVLNGLRKHVLKESLIEKKKCGVTKRKKNTCVYRSYNSNTTIHVSHGTMSKRNNSNS